MTRLSTDLQRWRIQAEGKGPGLLEYLNQHNIWVGVAPSEVPAEVREQLTPPRSSAEEAMELAREHAEDARRLAKAAERLASTKDPQAAAIAAASQAHGTAAIATAVVTPVVEIELDRLDTSSEIRS